MRKGNRRRRIEKESENESNKITGDKKTKVSDKREGKRGRRD